jgi:CHAT domain-containing protein
VVIADPTGDLPDAAKEGAMVAAALGPVSRVLGSGGSVPATRAGLLAARNATLWHVAAHVGTLGRWRALHLADGEMTPTDIVHDQLAPETAILASCGSGAATDEEGWGSIAAALLESGTATIVATDRSIADTASLAMFRELYAQSDWRTDPARALARVQQALDARSPGFADEVMKARFWAAFSVLRRPPFIAGRRP